MFKSSEANLTDAQNELYQWIQNYIKEFQHSPSIRQMMQAMGLKSPAPIQSRLKHLQQKGFISWQEGKARTLQLVEEAFNGIPVLGSIAAGGLIETYNDVKEEFNIKPVLEKKGIFALIVNGDSMINANIAHGDTVLIEPLNNYLSIRNGTIVSAMVYGLGTTLKYFNKKDNKIILEAANDNYEPIILDPNQVELQGKLVAIWRSI